MTRKQRNASEAPAAGNPTARPALTATKGGA
jgi:hypothetical protein